MPLVPVVLGHVDDIAGVQCQPQMWLPVLRAFITLDRERRGQSLRERRVEEGDTLARRGALPAAQIISPPHSAQLWALREDGGCGCPLLRREGVSLGNLQTSRATGGPPGAQLLIRKR